MNQSQAYLCLHPAERPSHLPPIPPLKVVTEHWAELRGWLTSDFLLVARSWFLFQPFLLAFATSERATLSVENTLSSLSCWLLPQSQLLSWQRFEEKESSKPHLPFQILGINAVVICSSHQASPEEWAGPVSGIKSASRDSSPTSPLPTGCSDDVGSLISKHWRPPSFLCVKIIMMSLK